MNRKSNCCFMCKDKRYFSHFVVPPYKNRAISTKTLNFSPILYNNYADFSATRIRPVVADDYRKWLILIFFTIFSHKPIDFPYIVCYNSQDKLSAENRR